MKIKKNNSEIRLNLTKYLLNISITYTIYHIRAVSSVVERLPYKQVVIGSNPIPPNNNRYRLICPLGPSSKGLGQGPSKSLM